MRDLHVQFATEDGVVKAVDGVSFSVEAGKTLGVVGESGSGKSVSMLTAMGLTRAENATISGSVEFEGRDLLTVSNDELRTVRGNDIAMIFQDPLSSLHPFYKVGNQIVEAMQAHREHLRRPLPASAPSSCWRWSASPTRASASTPTRTSSPAACASAR